MNLPPPLDPARHALFLDFDGTLVELVDRPEDVHIPPHAVARLAAIQAGCDGAFALLSGRRIADLDHFLSPMRFVAAGVHGLERREDPEGEVVPLAGPAGLDAIRLVLSIGVTEEPRLRLEDKGTGLVIHYRGFPDLAPAARELVTRAVQDEPGFSVMEGDNIVEVHLAGMDKGKALAAFMTHEPFVGRVPIYIGDDTTDEFGFAAVKALNGISIKVGDGPSEADFRLACVDSVHRWLGVEPVAGEGSMKEAS
ncbi:trehalose-phosphatase [uncultured Aureimonas sp.]|uniref:trehalose-phosphatase n=1 Tax=uncultured Aureimonas sp. TaxID=1604662 RepID=UPI0025F3EBB2|nr:trehalose-phosphatase [uncultured Aureimonas sp.]